MRRIHNVRADIIEGSQWVPFSQKGNAPHLTPLQTPAPDAERFFVGSPVGGEYAITIVYFLLEYRLATPEEVRAAEKAWAKAPPLKNGFRKLHREPAEQPAAEAQPEPPPSVQPPEPPAAKVEASDAEPASAPPASGPAPAELVKRNVDGWDLWFRKGEDGNDGKLIVLRDLDLAERAGLAVLRDIRRTIIKEIGDGVIDVLDAKTTAISSVVAAHATNCPVAIVTEEIVPRGSRGGTQTVTAYYLNQAAALHVLMCLRTQKALDQRKEVVGVFLKASRGELPGQFSKVMQAMLVEQNKALTALLGTVRQQGDRIDRQGQRIDGLIDRLEQRERPTLSPRSEPAQKRTRATKSEPIVEPAPACTQKTYTLEPEELYSATTHASLVGSDKRVQRKIRPQVLGKVAKALGFQTPEYSVLGPDLVGDTIRDAYKYKGKCLAPLIEYFATHKPAAPTPSAQPSLPGMA